MCACFCSLPSLYLHRSRPVPRKCYHPQWTAIPHRNQYNQGNPWDLPSGQSHPDSSSLELFSQVILNCIWNQRNVSTHIQPANQSLPLHYLENPYEVKAEMYQVLESESDWRPSRVCLEKQEMRKYSRDVSLEFFKVFSPYSVNEISVKIDLRFILIWVDMEII